MAAANGHVEVVRVLLEKGAAVNQGRTDTGATPLLRAAKKGHVEVVVMLLEKSAAGNQGKSDYGDTPLFMAAQQGHLLVVRVLLEKGAAVNQATTDDGATPLFAAAYEGHFEVVRVLLEKGAAVNQATTNDGATPLFAAAQNGHVEVVQLLAVFGVNTTTGNGIWTPQSVATCRGHFALAKWLAAVETWSPLQITAGCRLYRAAAPTLRLGLVDPEQGGIEVMLAAGAAATSTAPWGEIAVPPAPEEALLDVNNAVAAAAAAAAARAETERQRWDALAHVPACTLTTKFIRAATSGWSTTRHWLHHAAVRSAAHTLVLVSERLRRSAKDDPGGEGVELLLPHMPAELASQLWLLFAHFLRRSDWPVLPATAVHAAARAAGAP
jgi:ankyrin repeat protein